ncbi:MAG: selenium metabolism-associated LysR family transcriptional regulator [Actinomycetota bacterium]|nr:selenium metabolism-associated LysR family transcriptional regulator [Actinomycetota bacterium]
MNTKSLRIFIEVSRSGSFSAAARTMGLTQPAVSFQIRALEKEYGSILIDRSAGQCRLTEAGVSFLKHARSIVDMEEGLRRDMDERRSEISGPLLIAASNIPGEYILPRIMTDFKDRHPLSDPRLTIADSGEVLEQIRAGETDLGCVGYREEDERLEYGLLCSDRLVFIAPPSHPLSRRKAIDPEELRGESFVWRERGSGTRSHMVRILDDIGLAREVEGSMSLGSNMAVLQAVAACAGISLVSLWAADVYLRQGDVSALRIKGESLKRDFHHVKLRRRPSSTATSSFTKLLGEKRPELEERLDSMSL